MKRSRVSPVTQTFIVLLLTYLLNGEKERVRERERERANDRERRRKRETSASILHKKINVVYKL